MIYLDNAATTPVHPEVRLAMLPYLEERFGNPSSVHTLGREARAAVEKARRQLAGLVRCHPSRLVFTSGGTEANVTAIVGMLLASPPERRHIVTTSIEHHAVLSTVEFLHELGASVTYVHPLTTGIVDVNTILSAVRDDTCVVALMSINNELGTVQPIVEVSKRVKEQFPNVRVHSDMVQSLGKQVIDLMSSNVDTAAFSAHKIHGPKGVGALYVRDGVRFKPVMHGGGQERKRRSGTENVPGIVGFGVAANLLERDFSGHLNHLRTLDTFFCEALTQIAQCEIHGGRDRVPGILNAAFTGVRSDTLLMRLDLAGVAASAGSACTAGSPEPSHVLLACGLERERVLESVRFSFSALNTVEDVQQAALLVTRHVEELRNSFKPKL